MNDKIRKIAEENGFIHEHMTIGEQNDSLTKYRKFAELIVQECMNVLHDNELWNRHISNVLKEHFGVEE